MALHLTRFQEMEAACSTAVVSGFQIKQTGSGERFYVIQREKNNIFGHGREAFKTQDPKTLVFIDKYQTFEDLMEAMRKDEYGYSMFWEEFAAETDSAIHTFFARGREQYLRSLQGPIPSNDLFVVNDKTKHGSPQPCIYCIYIVYTLYIFCVCCYI